MTSTDLFFLQRQPKIINYLKLDATVSDAAVSQPHFQSVTSQSASVTSGEPISEQGYGPTGSSLLLSR
jgi:hypothetical protein